MARTQRKATSAKQKIVRDAMRDATDYYRVHPDQFCEEVLEIPLNLYQQVLMRAFFKKKYSMWVLSRGLGKTWLGALCIMIYGILYPKTEVGIIAPSFRQAKIVLEDKIVRDLLDRSPFLKGEVKKITMNMAICSLEFFNGSRVMAVPLGDGNKLRGYRFHVIFADEYAQIPSEIINLVINPMMNVKRGYEVGKVQYDDELGNRLLITSSAYYRHNHLYNLFKMYFHEMANGNDKYMVATLPYQIGLQVGLFDGDHIDKEKKRMTPMDFDMEYGCIFPNLSEDAWIDPRDLEACSTLLNLEMSGNNSKAYRYIMGLDVARVEGQDNTICHVVKLVHRKNHTEKQLRYTLSMNGEKFEEQAKQIRKLLLKYPNTDKIFMDTQTIGQGLADELSKEYYDVETMKLYPPLIDENDEQAVANITNGVPLIYGITPTAENNHKMGMAVKKATQKHHLQMYSLKAGDDKVERDEILSLEEEKQILEAEATRRELLGIEAKPNGMYFKFRPSYSRGRKDRWSALGLVLRGAEILEEVKEPEEQSVLVGKIERR